MTETGVDVPVLTDGVVTLRAHRPDDTAAMTEMCRDPEMARWTTVPVPYEEQMAAAFIGEIQEAWREQRSYCFAIEATGDHDVSGYAGNIDLRTQPRPDIGFALHPSARGRGLMTRAVRLATRWGFDVLGMPLIHWECHAGNLGSWRVAWACGFEFTGETPGYSPQRGELRDAWLGVLRAGDEQRPRTRWLAVPVLEGERVRLRPYESKDRQRVVEAVNDPGTRHWLSAMPDPYGFEEAGAFVARGRLAAARGQRVSWAVADRGTDQLLGDIGVFRLDDRMRPGGCEVGYWSHPDARGRGLMTEAVRLALQHALTPEDEGGLGCDRVGVGASWGNAASRGLAERLGFRLVGHFRLDGRLGDGTYEDGAWYDLLPGELR